MSAEPDDLEKLLGDVRKTISDNERFLRTLLEDAVDNTDIESEDAEEEQVGEGFEEL